MGQELYKIKEKLESEYSDFLLNFLASDSENVKLHEEKLKTLHSCLQDVTILCEKQDERRDNFLIKDHELNLRAEEIALKQDELNLRAKELASKEAQFATEKKEKGLQAVIEVVKVVLPSTLACVWMGRGLKFEESGCYTSRTKNFVSDTFRAFRLK